MMNASEHLLKVSVLSISLKKKKEVDKSSCAPKLCFSFNTPLSVALAFLVWAGN